MDAHAQPSPTLLAANRRLNELRAQLQAQDPTDNLSVGDGMLEAVKLPWNASRSATLVEKVAALPDHLGWGGAAVTAVIRATQPHQAKIGSVQILNQPPRSAACSPQTTPTALESSDKDTVKLFPDIALGLLHQSQEAPGRVWLLLRHLDREGQGRLRIDLVRERLTHEESAYHICGWRQLRNLLRQGEGVFWQQDKTYLWLRSAAKVATALGVEKLVGHPVALPLTVLLAGIGEVRAHFYASFHSGRRRNNPISRETLKTVTSVPQRTQQLYEDVAGVTRQRNIAIGERHTLENMQERAWQHGKTVFDFIDHHGRQGSEKAHYIAWHLPNSYEGCHQRCPKGRMKKINRQIDLVNIRAQGNGLQDRLFHTDGAKAGRAQGRQADNYWCNGQGRKRRRGLWHVLPGQGGASR